jgi:1-deoxy-D-xylulose-5-phosphate reductoisomerase
VFNAANEVAVAAFLEEEIPFLEILSSVERTLDAHTVTPDPDLDEIFEADRWAREEAEQQLQPSRAHP